MKTVQTKTKSLVAVLGGGALLANVAFAASPNALIVNEFNAVKEGKFFDLDYDKDWEGRDYGYFFNQTAGAGTYMPTTAQANDDGDEPRWDASPKAVDMQGRIDGNGGNWVELVVVEDNLDIRGWKLDWSNADPDSGVVTFSNDSRWSNLRSGTIVTVIETPDDLVPQVPVAYPNGTTGTAINVNTDFSYRPDTGDFWVNAWLGDGTLFTTGDWKVDNDDWQVTIKDSSDVTISGPVGENVLGWGGGGVNSREIGRLNIDPSDLVGVSNYDDADYSTFGAANSFNDNTETQDFDALRDWWINRIGGDANLDGEVSILDLNVLGANFGEAGFWADGDFNADGDVTILDLNILGSNFGIGSGSPLTFEEALVATGLSALVPEPTSLALLAGGGLLALRRRRAV